MTTRRVQLTQKVSRDLKFVNGLSSRNRWEYAGRLKYDKNFNYMGLTFVTSKKRSSVDGLLLQIECGAPITYHTHPGVLEFNTEGATWDIFTTLPSASDFDLYIKSFPTTQVNIICDVHGYYVIDIIEASKMHTLPLPEQVKLEMNTVRYEDFLYRRGFSEDRLEYFYTSLPEWKAFINNELSPRMTELFGISINYYGYEDEPPSVSLVV